MKIQKKETSFIREGDSITVAVTHEIKIDRESSWIRYEVTSKVAEETCEDASRRVIGFAAEGVMDAVHKTVETVRNR